MIIPRLGSFGLMSVFVTGIVISACDHTPNTEPATGSALEFGPRAVHTRVIDQAATNALTSMGVFSAITTGNWTDQAQCLYAYNLQVTRTVTPTTTPWTYNGLLYWPTPESGNKLSFFAYSPYNAASVISDAQFKGTPTINYTSLADPTTGMLKIADLQKQNDLLVASAIKDRVDGNGKVLFDFRHALTQIRFQARKTVSVVPPGGNSVYINKISLRAINTQGTAPLDFTTVPLWQNPQAPNSVTLYTDPTAGTLKKIDLSDTYQWLIPTYNAGDAEGSSSLLLLPQDFSNSGARLEIEFAFRGGVAVDPITLAVTINSFNTSWDPGKSLVLQITYDGTFVPAIFSALVDWVPKTGTGDVGLN